MIFGFDDPDLQAPGEARPEASPGNASAHDQDIEICHSRSRLRFRKP
jgi:hypothetical protein